MVSERKPDFLKYEFGVFSLADLTWARQGGPILQLIYLSSLGPWRWTSWSDEEENVNLWFQVYVIHMWGLRTYFLCVF